jgi:hypothetical protein
MPLSRRHFIGLAATGTAGALLPGCSWTDDKAASDSPNSAPRPEVLLAPSQVVAAPETNEGSDAVVQLRWNPVRDAQSYDIELNGAVVASGVHSTNFDITGGDGRPGLSVGQNSTRVRARAGVVEGEWSDARSFAVRAIGTIRARGFDAEGDGPIELTTGPGEPPSGAELVVGARYAFGGGGKGVAMICTDPTNTKAYKNHAMLPVEQCWVRLSFRPQSSSKDGRRVQIARINDSVSNTSERLFWVTGQGVTSTSVKVEVGVREEQWLQLQLGVDAEGRVELWAFDGVRESLVGTGRSDLIGATKDRISFGNHSPELDVEFEAWIDDLAVGRVRLPWVRTDDPREIRRPKRLDPAALPPTFRFVFGSCSNSNHVPAIGTALEAASGLDPDFVLHLGDLGYVDSSAYAQSADGYLASWSDHLAGEHMERLADRPWINVSSDHDLGGNNVVAATVAPFAADAFARFQRNDPAADGVGRYGSVLLDEGNILLIWTEGVLYRSAVDNPDAPDNTKLGAEQKAWLLNLLATNTAPLVLIASETCLGHQSSTSWSNHPAERREILDAAAASAPNVRFLSGDLHHANYARFADNCAEWGAAAMSEFPEGKPKPVPDVLDAAQPGYPGYRSRVSALESLTIPEFNSTTTFGLVEVDTTAGSIRIGLLDNTGQVRVSDTGWPMTETFAYR